MVVFSLAEGTLDLCWGKETYIHILKSSLEMIMQMVEKLWHILPTSCACTLGKKIGTKTV